MAFLPRTSLSLYNNTYKTKKKLKNNNCLKGAVVIQLFTIVKVSTENEWSFSYCMNHPEKGERKNRDIIMY